ncbi:ABC transporter permease [Arthrobacter sp. 179]|uniref:ABC transporter permease n=1 Tax=Arthrobacter sp. 179 TaxID=3457734 RepID=UPI004034C87B
MSEQPVDTVQKPVVYVDITGMRQPGTHGGMAEYLLRMWDARTLAFHEARSKIVSGHQRNKLGSLWLILNPIFSGMIYYIVFGFVFQVNKGIDNFIGYLLVGIFMFQMTTGAINASADSIYSGRKLLGSNNLPVAMLPVINNVQRWLSGIPSYLAMMLIIIIAPPVENLGWMSLLFVPLMALQGLLMIGFSLVAAHVVARVHDLKNLLSVGMRAWLYASGVMFSVDRLTNAHPIFGPLVDWNPMHHVLTIARDVLLYETIPDLHSWLMVLFWALGITMVGLWLIWRGEGTYVITTD